ncbi:MAG: hypothetical protein HY077_01155 [Elusimicrobia bacterium]|nr:hypothetical protein [Elusimicrobiota bacterium]
MKKILIVFSALSLIPSLGHSRGRSAGGFRAAGSRTSAASSHFTSISASRGLGGGGTLIGAKRSAAASQVSYPGLPPVEGALIRDPSMFVRYDPTGEPQRWHSVNAGGVLIASDDSKSQPLGGGGVTGSAMNSGGFGTFFQNFSNTTPAGGAGTSGSTSQGTGASH